MLQRLLGGACPRLGGAVGTRRRAAAGSGRGADLPFKAGKAQCDAKNNAVIDAPLSKQCARVNCRMRESCCLVQAALRI